MYKNLALLYHRGIYNQNAFVEHLGSDKQSILEYTHTSVKEKAPDTNGIV